MATAEETATKLVDGTFEVLMGDHAYKAKVAASIVDQMIGSDPHALVSSIPGIPPSMFEALSDGLIGALEGAVLKKLTGGV